MNKDQAQILIRRKNFESNREHVKRINGCNKPIHSCTRSVYNTQKTNEHTTSTERNLLFSFHLTRLLGYLINNNTDHQCFVSIHTFSASNEQKKAIAIKAVKRLTIKHRMRNRSNKTWEWILYGIRMDDFVTNRGEIWKCTEFQS